MKLLRYTMLIFVFFLGINNVLANDKYTVTLNKCVDGDTAYFNQDDKVIKTRFLAIDTPESTNEIEKFGKEASTFTCNKLSSAELIEIEYDLNSAKKDKYDRDLVWVWVDNILLQETLLKEGLAEVKYLYGDYDYTAHLQEIEAVAKSSELKIWGDGEETVVQEEETEDETTKESYTTEDIIYFVAVLLILFAKILFKKKKK